VRLSRAAVRSSPNTIDYRTPRGNYSLGDVKCALCCPALAAILHDALLELDIARVGGLAGFHWTRGLETYNGHLDVWTLQPYVSSL